MKIILLTILLYFSSSATYSSDIVFYKEIDKNEISREMILSIFTLKTAYWNNGEQITVFIKPINSIEHFLFLSEWLGISRYRYNKIIKSKLFSGSRVPLQEVLSDAEMIQHILDTPYSIGYITDGKLIFSYIDKTQLDKVNILYYE